MNKIRKRYSPSTIFLSRYRPMHGSTRKHAHAKCRWWFLMAKFPHTISAWFEVSLWWVPINNCMIYASMSGVPHDVSWVLSDHDRRSAIISLVMAWSRRKGHYHFTQATDALKAIWFQFCQFAFPPIPHQKIFRQIHTDIVSPATHQAYQWNRGLTSARFRAS
jgi:hypothetical protein